MNRKFYCIVCLFVFSFFGTNLLVAQDISFPFECGFEDSIEVSEWHLNVGADAVNCNEQWMVGGLDFAISDFKVCS